MNKKINITQLRAPRIAAAISVALAVLKISVGMNNSSLSLLASGFDSVFDAMASGASFILLRMSLEPADDEHPYGHSRIEAIASLAQGFLLLIVSIGLAYTAAQRFDHQHEPQNINATIIVPFICSLITLGLWLYLGYVVRKTKSKVVAADRLHYFTDLAGNVLIFVGFVIAQFWHLYNVDAILTLILCVFILAGVYEIISGAVNDLVDRNDPEVETKVKSILEKFYPDALGAARIRSRKSGRQTALDIELLGCRLKLFQDVHDISHDVQQAILREMPDLDLIIHSEPCDVTYCATDRDCQVKLVERGHKPRN